MSRAFQWQPCSRLLEEQWHESELQQHRARLESIHTLPANNVSPTKPVKLVSRSQSPAAKARQKQIDRENLILIKKIIALDSSSSSSSSTNKPSKSLHSKGSSQNKKKQTGRQPQAPADRNAIVIPEAAHSSSCLRQQKPLPDVPPASCHPLYTHHSATMKNNFADLNGSTLHLSGSASSTRIRTQIQIQDENKRLLQRILSARKSYSRMQWSEQERERRKLLRNISRHHSSTSRLPEYHGNRGALGSVLGLQNGVPGRSLRRHNSSSSEELTPTAALGIRVLPTTHLKPSQQRQTQTQRPLSASAVTRSTIATATAKNNTWTASPGRKSPTESIVQRMRSMTIDRRVYDESGDGEAEDAQDDEGEGDGGHNDEEDDDTEALLQDLA